MSSAEYLAGLMATDPNHFEIQKAQTAFRLRVLDHWQIKEGSRILEIGCGQGDMTAVLADAVGSQGHVTAIDIANPNYGSPFTLAEAANRLKGGELGARIEFHFDFDLLSADVDFPENSFDYLVLSHCAWYFSSMDELAQVLRRGRIWSSNLCFSEWDLHPLSCEEVGHMLAILIQGQLQLREADSSLNVRTPFSRHQLRKLLLQTGWLIAADELVPSTGMEDGAWEVQNCLRSAFAEGTEIDLTAKEALFLRSQLDVLQELVSSGPIHPLSSYAISARRPT